MLNVRQIGISSALGFAAALSLLGTTPSRAAGYLEGLHHHPTVASTITDNGDLNPYAVVIAPVSSGKIHKGDVLVDNFNNQSNLQGTGTTIVIINPSTKSVTLLAKLPQNLPQCPGGIGLTTAMTMLSSGWIIVGSMPSTDGTTKTKGNGCLLVFDSSGKLTTVWKGSRINGPWGNMAVIDKGTTATLFVSMSGFDVPGPDKLDPATGDPVIVKKATILRIDLSIAAGGPPKVTGQNIIANGFAQRADKDVFLVGPTGLALIGTTLYASDAVENRIVAIADAPTRSDSAGTGRTVTKDGLLKRPLALAVTAGGHILTTNALNGQVVEFDPASGKQLSAQWIDTNQAQTPPGNGDLFGLAMAPDGSGFYYVQDDVNMLAKATQ
jgi:sugar lactone lactonase YvrE